MADITLRWQNIAGLHRFDNAVKALGGPEMTKVLNRAINRAGDQAKTQVTRALTAQTGLKRQVIVRAIKVNRSGWGARIPNGSALTYRMSATGGDVSLKFFGPKETGTGVSAAPFGQRTVFAGSFLSGGEWPGGRKGLIAGGHGFFRVGPARLAIRKAKSGVIIPAEMVKGQTADAFESTVARVLPARVEHEIKRATKGVVT